MMSTMRSKPTPVPYTPRILDSEAKRPMKIPPTMVMIGMYLERIASTEVPALLKPGTMTSAPIRFFAAALGDRPPISTHMRANITEKITANNT